MTAEFPPYDSTPKSLTQMFEYIWEGDAAIRQIKAEAEAKGIATGEIKATKDIVLLIVRIRFPELVPLVREKVENITTIELLHLLVRLIVLAPDEATARWTLSSFAA